MSADYDSEEARWIRTIQGGDSAAARDALGCLYENNDPKLRLYLCKACGLQSFEIDEICSQVWERAINNLPSYIPTGVPYFAWLKNVANFVRKELQRKERQAVPIKDGLDFEDKSDWGKDPLLGLLDLEEEHELEQRRLEIQEAVRESTLALPKGSRNVLQALEELGFSSAEAAYLLGWSVDKVYSEYYRAKQRLKQKLLERYGMEYVDKWLGKQIWREP